MLPEKEAVLKIYAQINDTLNDIRKRRSGNSDDQIIADYTQEIDHHEIETLAYQFTYMNTLLRVLSFLEVSLEMRDLGLEDLVRRYCEIIP